jgi:predicted site-specific integrase-resolvase
MEDLHAAIATFLRRQRPGPAPHRHRSDTSPAEVRETVIYARVAGTDRSEAAALDIQIAVCRAFAQVRGATCSVVFADVADGLDLERPRLAELRALIARGRVGTVLVASTDHLTPDRGLLLALAAEWEAIGVNIVAAGTGS